MILIKNTPEVNGAYANQFSPVEFEPPDGWSRVPDDFVHIANSSLPFIIPVFEDGVLVAIKDNPDKPPPPEPLAQPVSRITEMQNSIDLLLLSVLEV